MLFKLVITFLPRSKRLLISWLQSPSAVILEPKKMKSDTVSTVSPSISREVMGPHAMILYLVQYSGLVNSIDYIVHGVTKSQTQLSDFHFLGNSGGQRSLVCCSSWGLKELDTTEQLNNNSKTFIAIKNIKSFHDQI